MSRGFNLADYVPVQERIRQFWTEYPDGRIETDLMSDPTDYQSCRYVARVYKHLGDERASSTGWAFEHASERGPNQTSHEENCETSAIGRALANFGYATSQKDRPSREEMAKVEIGARPTVDADGVIHDAPVFTDQQLRADIASLVKQAGACMDANQLRICAVRAKKLGLDGDAEVAGAIEARRQALGIPLRTEQSELVPV